MSGDSIVTYTNFRIMSLLKIMIRSLVLIVLQFKMLMKERSNCMKELADIDETEQYSNFKIVRICI